jgi:hypothetical protein
MDEIDEMLETATQMLRKVEEPGFSIGDEDRKKLIADLKHDSAVVKKVSFTGKAGEVSELLLLFSDRGVAQRPIAKCLGWSQSKVGRQLKTAKQVRDIASAYDSIVLRLESLELEPKCESHDSEPEIATLKATELDTERESNDSSSWKRMRESEA